MLCATHYAKFVFKSSIREVEQYLIVILDSNTNSLQQDRNLLKMYSLYSISFYVIFIILVGLIF